MDTFYQSLSKGEIEKVLDDTFSPFVQNVMSTHDLPGLAIGIVAGNETVYARGFGVRSIETREPVTMTTLFHLASISKPFVATAILQLVEQGRVRLDAPVITYLPYFKLADDRYRAITIQQMLSHVSGMPDEEDYEWDNPQYDDGALERYVRSLPAEKLLSEPGEKYAYSNMAFECLGDVIAKVSGMAFDDYVKQHILALAGMAESSFLMPERLPEAWAAPHLRVMSNLAWKGYPYNRMHGPSSTLHSNALEMCNWAITNLNRGRFGDHQILNPSSYDLLWKPRAERSKDRQVGLSWFLGEYRREKLVQHGGGDTGFRSHLDLLPDRRAGVVVLCNLIPAPVEEIAYAALDVLLGYEPGPILPPVSIPVCETLRQEGLDAAASRWNSLRSSHPEEYNFSSPLFSNLHTAMQLERIDEAELIAHLCARVLPEPDLKVMEDQFSQFQEKLAPVILRALRG